MRKRSGPLISCLIPEYWKRKLLADHWPLLLVIELPELVTLTGLNRSAYGMSNPIGFRRSRLLGSWRSQVKSHRLTTSSIR